LALSATRIKFGHERAERIATTTVIPRLAGVVLGTVTVKAGRKTVCTIRLNHGSGSCRLSARELRPGSYKLRAHYNGTTRFAASSARAARLVVAP
jgi:hypothetical protein